MKTESPEYSTRFINQSFVNKIFSGQEKEAAEAGSKFIRDRLREDSFARKIMGVRNIGPGQLDKSLDAGQLRVIFDKEPDARAMSMAFRDTAEHTWFDSERFELRFFKIESQRFNKNKWELMDYDWDIRDVLTKNAAKAMSDEEDKYFLRGVMEMGINEMDLKGETRYNGVKSDKTEIHYLHMPSDGKITLPAVREITSLAAAKKVPVGGILCNFSTYETLIELQHSVIGSKATDHYVSGTKSETGVLGHRFIRTIKNELIPDGVCLMFAPGEFFGVYAELAAPTMFIETRADLINFHSYMSVGCSLANHRGFGILDLRGKSGSTAMTDYSDIKGAFEALAPTV